MLNPAKLFQIKAAWSQFQTNHPKFPNFIKAANARGIEPGTVIEISITDTAGEKIASNIRVTESDMELFQNMKELTSSL